MYLSRYEQLFVISGKIIIYCAFHDLLNHIACLRIAVSASYQQRMKSGSSATWVEIFMSVDSLPSA